MRQRESRPIRACRRHRRAGEVALAAALLGSVPPTHGSSWFRIHAPDQAAMPSVEVDVRALHAPLGQPETVVRVTLAQPADHPQGFRYRSFLAVLRFDCVGHGMRPLAVRYFPAAAAAGRELDAESTLTAAGIQPGLLDLLPPQSRTLLLRAACGG